MQDCHIRLRIPAIMKKIMSEFNKLKDKIQPLGEQ